MNVISPAPSVAGAVHRWAIGSEIPERAYLCVTDPSHPDELLKFVVSWGCIYPAAAIPVAPSNPDVYASMPLTLPDPLALSIHK